MELVYSKKMSKRVECMVKLGGSMSVKEKTIQHSFFIDNHPEREVSWRNMTHK